MPHDVQTSNLELGPTGLEPGTVPSDAPVPQHPPPAPHPRPPQRYTGPRFPEGKAISSRNPTKHGILARDIIVTHGHTPDNPADYIELLAETRRAYRPDNPLEDLIVERIAFATWRLRRTQRFEIGAIHDNLSACRAAAEREVAHADAAEEDRLKQLRGDIGEARAYLKYLQDHPSADPFDDHLTFDLDPVMTDIAEAHARLRPAGMIEEHDGERCSQFVRELGFDSRDQIRQVVLDALQRAIDRRTEKLEKLQVARSTGQEARQPDLETAALLGSIPAQDRLKLLIRYENTLRGDRDRAIAELTALRRSNSNSSDVDRER